MLKTLYIKNYALIDDVSLRFTNGFTVITGETGAGKSILLGALSLLLGKRADYSVLRDESGKCVVEGNFNLKNLNITDFFAAHDLDYDDDTWIRREIISSGRSRAFVNDTPVKLDLLKELGDQLINIHSQHETLQIGKSLFQMQVLDNFIEEPDLFAGFKKSYADYIGMEGELNGLIEENEQSKRDEDYYRFQYEELHVVNLVEGEDERLIEREKLLTHAEEVTQGINQVNKLLSEDDETIIDKLKQVQDWLSRVGKFHSGIEGLIQRVESSRIELEDISEELSKMDSITDFDPNELEEIATRLNAIYKLQQKHQESSIDGLLKLQAEYKEKLTKLENSDELIDHLKIKLSQTKEKAKKFALQIHRLRNKEADNLSYSVKVLLKKLGMKDAGFEVVVQDTDSLNQYGSDKVSFLFNANAGGKLQEISDVASGGELSRLMLAIKSLVTREQLLPTVVFDEIDAGVSGEIAGKVGNIIKSMSYHHQIIAITHLPQIAAKCDEHFKVFKKLENRTTKTHILLLDQKARIEEIAKLLSDEKVTDSAMDTARELLKV